MKAINRRRFGFTLVELLAVTVIIAILASLTTVATTSAMRSAREAKTRGTIAKLDTAMQEIFEGYEEKFDSIGGRRGDNTSNVHNVGSLANYMLNKTASIEEIAKVKLHFIRDLMRMEMPVTWNEVTSDPIKLEDNSREIWVDAPRVKQFYLNAQANKTTSNLMASSELLYLIIMNLNPEALSNFNDGEIGDYDGNGLFEFHDAWGTPIMFLRWAPAFPDSDRQPDVITQSGYQLGTGNNATDWKDGPSDWDSLSSSLRTAMQTANTESHDPFDEDKIARGWFLYPLVYSAGADQIDDIYRANIEVGGNFPTRYTFPTILDPFGRASGIPLDEMAPDGSAKNGVLNHFDNIHNHRSSGGF